MGLWDMYSKVYDTVRHWKPYQQLLQDICSEIDIKPGTVVLDAGCGTGNLCEALAVNSPPASIIGIDFSRQMLDIAQEKLKNTSVKLYQIDLNSPLPFKSGTFDYIAVVNTLYAVKNPASVLRELYRVQKRGGKIIVVNPFPGARALPVHQNIDPRGANWAQLGRDIALGSYINRIIYSKGRSREFH
ncbi:MAG: methyltransferase domain-containing protein, partial [Syntrophomonadaceae bacterium]|nr:methyltransferase domain-containing protein [Syntrophomonadaceae bacterium]